LLGFAGGDGVVLSASHAKSADKKYHAHLINTVEGLSIAAGIPIPKIYVIPDKTINAFATGRNPKAASVAVTVGALEKLNRSELEGVIAHELSHIKNYDIRLMMLTTIMIGIVVLLSDFLLRSFMFSSGDNDRGVNPVLIVVALLMSILTPIIGYMIQLAISRKREFLADAGGAMLSRHPQGLADALKKIKNDHDKPAATANKAMAHMYLSNPFKGKDWLSTHPDINERIKRLEAM
jgi:heat shock protein HtpX